MKKKLHKIVSKNLVIFTIAFFCQWSIVTKNYCCFCEFCLLTTTYFLWYNYSNPPAHPIGGRSQCFTLYSDNALTWQSVVSKKEIGDCPLFLDQSIKDIFYCFVAQLLKFAKVAKLNHFSVLMPTLFN